MCVHKIMNMYIHGMYMVQTCMNRFAHLCGGGRIPDVYRRVCTMSIQLLTFMNLYVPCTYKYINACTCMYMVHTNALHHVHVHTMYIHVHESMNLHTHVHTCPYHVQTRTYRFAISIPGR